MLLAIGAAVAAALLLGYLVWLRRDIKRTDIPLPALPEGERRAEHAIMLRLLENLDTLDDRYRIFTYRVMRAVAVIGVACTLALAYEGKLARDSSEQAKLANSIAAEQASGRAVAIDALCGAVSGVVDAGRETITGAAAAPDTDFTRALEKLGYPPRKIRKAAAVVAAREYGRSIAKAVEDATHREGLSRKDGTLDCSRLKSVAKAQP